MLIKNCLYCNKEFIANVSSRKFCCKKCWDLKQRKVENFKLCIICGKEFKTSGNKDRNSVVCCSRKCSSIYRRTEEYQNKMNKYVGERWWSKPLLEKNKKICVICGKEYRVRGKKRRNNSKTCSGKCYGIWRSQNFIGKNHPRFTDYGNEIGRLRGTLQYDEWRKKVYRKNGWICQQCGKHCKHDIVAHHIKSFKDFPSLRFDVDNGITLCRSCHKKIHVEIGSKTKFK